jgi:hypothetical protein
MKKRTRIVTLAVVSMSLILGGTTAALADTNAGNTYNGVYSHERSFLWYDGAVWISPCYVYSGKHNLSGYMRWTISGYADTGRLYTPGVSGPGDCAKHTKTYTFSDSLDPNAPQTQFFYGFTVVASNIW